MAVETKHDTVMDTYQNHEETDVQAELREMIQEIAQYTIDHVIVENLQKTEQKYVKALPEMEKQIADLKSTVVNLEGEKRKIINGINTEHQLLFSDRERLNQLKKDLTELSEVTRDSLHKLTNENLQLRKKIEQAMAENIAVKKTIDSVTFATAKVEVALSNMSKETSKLAETTDAGFEVSHSLRSKNHKFTLGLLFTILIVQFGILAFLLV